ncbi:MAG: DUF2071 domain-containing protein [Verrucomicrobiota bacterium]
MTQRWKDLLFLHWRFEEGAIAKTLPEGLRVDTFDGSAWVGIVPFQMEKVRVLGFPLPGKRSAFPELNLRTYVRDWKDRPGVWFYSLDAGAPFAVWGARVFFHLNYKNARMSVSVVDDSIHYRSERRNRHTENPIDEFIWRRPSEGLQTARPETLEYFLLERYRLFASNPRNEKLYTGTVSHEPYRFAPVTPDKWTAHLFPLNGFEPLERPPESCLASPGFPVRIHPLEKVS